MNRDLGIVLPTLLAAGETPLHSERRAHERHPLAVRCWMADGHSTIYARVHDVSLGGLSIRAPVPFVLDAELELAIVLPSLEGREPGSTVAVRARGRVVWVRAREGGARMGAKFLRIESGANALARIVE